MTLVKFTVAVVLWLIAGLLAPAALAQSRPTGPCPEPAEPGADAWALMPDQLLSTRPRGGNRIEGAPALAAGDWMEIIDADRVNESVYVRTGGRCGWLPERAVASAPLTMGQLARIRGETDEKALANLLSVKVIVKTTDLDRLRGGDGAAKIVEAPIFNAPGGAQISKVSVFSLFHVFKVMTIESKTYYFLGGQRPGRGVQARESGDLIGWIREEDIEVWDNRINVYYNARSGKALRIFASAADLIKDEHYIASRPLGWQEPDKTNIIRFPILSGREIEPGTMAYRVLYFGAGQMTGSSTTVPADTALQNINKVRVVMEKARNIDVLFVIDATESMGSYLKAVADAVNAASEDMKNHFASKSGQIRVSAAVYGDYLQTIGNIDQIQFKVVAPFGLPNDTRELEGLRNLDTFIDPQKDKPEAAFAGLIKAVRGADWSRSADLRLVVWIGDHPNRTSSDRDASEVIAAFNENGVNAFLPVNVYGQYIKEHNDTFVKQAQEIIAKGKYAAFDFVRAYDPATKTSLPPDRVGILVREYLGYTLLASDAAPRYLQLTTVNPDAAREYMQKLPFPVAQFVKDYLSRLGLDDERLRQTYDLKQLVTTGFIRVDQRSKDDVVFWVAMFPNEFNDLSYITKQMCEASMRTSDAARILENAFVQMVSVMSGDRPFDSKESIRSFLSRVLYLPKEYFTSLVDKDLDGLREWLRRSTDEQRLPLVRTMCRSSKLLQLVENEKGVSPDSLTFDPATKQFKLNGQPEKFDWMWGLANGMRFYVIPASFLPSDG